jgi:hypothetical protein
VGTAQNAHYKPDPCASGCFQIGSSVPERNYPRGVSAIQTSHGFDNQIWGRSARWNLIAAYHRIDSTHPAHLLKQLHGENRF